MEDETPRTIHPVTMFGNDKFSGLGRAMKIEPSEAQGERDDGTSPRPSSDSPKKAALHAVSDDDLVPDVEDDSSGSKSGKKQGTPEKR